MFAQDLTDAGDGTAGADAGAESVDRSADLCEDLQCGLVAVYLRIGRVLELLGDKNLGVFLRHAHGGCGALGDALADVAVVVNQNDLGAVVADQLAAFLTDRIRHDDDGLVSAHSADQRQTDALISACRLDDDGILGQEPLFLRIRDHIERGAGFDGSADVETLELDKDLCAVRIAQTIQTHNRRVAHRRKNILVYHENLPR